MDIIVYKYIKICLNHPMFRKVTAARKIVHFFLVSQLSVQSSSMPKCGSDLPSVMQLLLIQKEACC
jgi:hypothetical protein